MILNVDGLEFSYASKEVLNDINFTIRTGDCVAILGTNGAGKSTLLKCISRILKSKSGKIEVEGVDTSELKPNDLAKKIAYVAQAGNQNRMNVFDTVLIGRKPYIKWNVTQKDIDITQNVLKLLELEPYKMRYIDELSGGEYQKVAIARAIVQQPKLLMLDEPTASLDLKNQLEVVKIVRDIVEKEQIGAIVTIHDLNLALRLANKFIFLKNGKIFEAGGIETIRADTIESVYSIPSIVKKIDDKTIVIPK